MWPRLMWPLRRPRDAATRMVAPRACIREGARGQETGGQYTTLFFCHCLRISHDFARFCFVEHTFCSVLMGTPLLSPVLCGSLL